MKTENEVLIGTFEEHQEYWGNNGPVVMGYWDSKWHIYEVQYPNGTSAESNRLIGDGILPIGDRFPSQIGKIQFSATKEGQINYVHIKSGIYNRQFQKIKIV